MKATKYCILKVKPFQSLSEDMSQLKAADIMVREGKRKYNISTYHHTTKEGLENVRKMYPTDLEQYLETKCSACRRKFRELFEVGNNKIFL